MKRKTGLYGLGLFAVTAALTMSCSGDDGAGTNTTAGTGTTGGGGAGTVAGNSSGGKAAGGTNTTAGNPTAGNPTAGNNNPPQGGDGPGPNQGGDGPGPNQGGAGNIGGPCDQGVEDGADCEQGDLACELENGDTCVCFGFGQNRMWNCGDGGGQGGAGNGGGDVTCPENAMDDDACTGGPGICPEQQCFCNQNDMVMCF